MFRVAICEDEAAIRDDLAARCKRILARMEVACEIDTFDCAEALEAAIGEDGGRFELLLLDIVLPGKSGVALGKTLREWNDRVGIVFITGSESYAMEGYKAQPSAYLLKPVSDEALADALKRELKRRHLHEMAAFPDRGRVVRLPASEIRYLESYDHGVRVHAAEETLGFSLTLTKAEALLPNGMFARCHNSYVVNLNQIQSASSVKVRLRSGEELPVGRVYRDAFHRRFIAHFF